jgi:serine/threonine-protein kinase HipA
MKKARILVNSTVAGVLEQLDDAKYRFIYNTDYHGPPVSLTLPLEKISYEFNRFPPFFEGLLPEGVMLEALLRKHKLDKNAYFEQLLKVGQDVVGAVTVEELA